MRTLTALTILATLATHVATVPSASAGECFGLPAGDPRVAVPAGDAASLGASCEGFGYSGSGGGYAYSVHDDRLVVSLEWTDASGAHARVVTLRTFGSSSTYSAPFEPFTGTYEEATVTLDSADGSTSSSDTVGLARHDYASTSQSGDSTTLFTQASDSDGEYAVTGIQLNHGTYSDGGEWCGTSIWSTDPALHGLAVPVPQETCVLL